MTQQRGFIFRQLSNSFKQTDVHNEECYSFRVSPLYE